MFVRVAFALTLTANAVMSAPSMAQTADRAALKQHCTGDYLTYCGDFAPDTPELSACFKQNKAKLSTNCQGAIATYVKDRRKG